MSKKKVKILTEEQLKNHLNKPDKCPSCGSEEIDMHDLEGEHGEQIGHYYCFDCPCQWSAYFKLHKIEQIIPRK